MGQGDGQAEVFGARTPDGRWWWNGYRWLLLPEALLPQPPREWPPPGYYRRPPAGRLTRWDGTDWGRVYWRWWRIAATVVASIVGGFVTLATGSAFFAHPVVNGDTSVFEDLKSLRGGLFLLCGAVALLLLWLLTRPVLRRPVETPTPASPGSAVQPARRPRWAARGVALGAVVGFWLVFYGFQPWPGLDRTVATYPVPAHWRAHGKPVHNGACGAWRVKVDPGCPPDSPSETVIYLPDHSSGNSHPEISTAKSRAEESDACAAIRASVRAWTKVGFVAAPDAGDCQVEGKIRGRSIMLSLDHCHCFSDPSQTAPDIELQVFD